MLTKQSHVVFAFHTFKDGEMQLSWVPNDCQLDSKILYCSFPERLACVCVGAGGSNLCKSRKELLSFPATGTKHWRKKKCPSSAKKARFVNLSSVIKYVNGLWASPWQIINERKPFSRNMPCHLSVSTPISSPVRWSQDTGLSTLLKSLPPRHLLHSDNNNKMYIDHYSLPSHAFIY